MDFNALHGALKTISIYYSLRDAASLISLLFIATVVDGLEMLVKNSTMALYGTLMYGTELVHTSKEMGRVGAVRGLPLSILIDEKRKRGI